MKHLLATVFAMSIIMPASAAEIITLNWSGTIENSILQTSYGNSSTELNGLSLNVVFTIDTRKGRIFNYPNDDRVDVTYHEGDPGLSPISALVTIGALPSRLVDGSYSAGVEVSNNDDVTGSDYVNYQSDELASSLAHNILTYHDASAIASASDSAMMLIDTGSLSAPLMVTPAMFKYLRVDFTDYVRDLDTLEYMSYTRIVAQAQAQSISVSLTSVTIPDVPEPSSWAMLLVGFGAVGAVLRRPRTPLRWAGPR